VFEQEFENFKSRANSDHHIKAFWEKFNDARDHLTILLSNQELSDLVKATKIKRENTLAYYLSECKDLTV
jgi:hypothetical protein